MRASSGFTLVELLIAGAILVLLLSVLGGLYVSSSRSYETNRTATEAAGQLRTAVQAIQRDFSQAGYMGTAIGASFEPLEFTLGQQAGNVYPLNSLTMRYMEEAGDTVELSVTYTVEGGVLLRRLGGSEPQPLAEGVAGMEVVRFIEQTGGPTPALRSAQDVKGLELRLHYLQGSNLRTEEFAVTRP